MWPKVRVGARARTRTQTLPRPRRRRRRRRRALEQAAATRARRWLTCTPPRSQCQLAADAAAAAGAEDSLLVTPYYNKPPQEGLYRHFCKVAAAVNIPIILYNVPSRTGIDLSNETVLRLSEVGNIAGLKDATGDVQRGGALIAKLPDTFSVYSGDDATAFDLMSLGGRGNVSVTANIAATQVAEVCRLAIVGDIEGAGKINAELDALNNALFIEPNPIPIKWAMLELGMIKDGIRLPLVALSSKHQETVLNAIRQAGL